MAIAELFLSSVVKTLLNYLSSEILAVYSRINGISQKLTDWKRMLRIIESVMDSAEERQMDGDSAVHDWLTDLRDVAFDMEDLLDCFSIDAKRHDASNCRPMSGKHLPSCLISCCSRIDPRTLLKDYRFANEIEELDCRLKEILRQKKTLDLVVSSKRIAPFSSQPRFSTTAIPEPMFFGREKHKKELLAQLTRIEPTENSVGPFAVVSIVGMGGIGKTTLAQVLYDHESVSNSFNIRAWACVSDVFDMVAITRSVLECVNRSFSCEGKDLNWLQSSLRDQLSGKKFLVVLDDVWNENYEELQFLLKPFFSGSKGSKISKYYLPSTIDSSLS